MKHLAKALATCFGTGYAPLAPGTVGAMVAVIIYYCLPEISLPAWLLILVGLFVIGVWSASQTEIELGHDAPEINIDEVLGQLMPLVIVEKTFFNLIAAFVLFRLFDIVKPFPVNKSQQLARGWGIMLDDVLAGIYTAIGLKLLILAKDALLN